MAHWNLQSTHFTRTFANSNYFSFPFRVWVTGQGLYCIFLFRVHSLFQEGSVGWKLAGRVMSSECMDSWKMLNRVVSHILKEQAAQNVFLCWFLAKQYGLFRKSLLLGLLCSATLKFELPCFVTGNTKRNGICVDIWSLWQTAYPKWHRKRFVFQYYLQLALR